MPLRTWSRRKLALLWLGGLLVEGGLLGASALQGRRASARADLEWERTFGPARPASPAERQAMLRRLEAEGITLRMRGDTVSGVTLSPEAQRKARESGVGIREVARGMTPVLVTLMVVVYVLYLAVPLSLLLVTILWFRARRRETAGVPAT